MSATISLAIITNGEASLAHAVASARPYVDEVAIVDTRVGDVDESPVRALADVYERNTECRDADGEMADFSVARKRSFDLCSGDFVLWLDSDDELVGGDKLREMVSTAPPGPCYYFLPYEYETDERGACKCRQGRQRVIRAGSMHWEEPIHEDLVPSTQPIARGETDGVFVRHLRKGPANTARNLRILRRQIAENPNNPRATFYLGMALFDTEAWDEAHEAFRRYLDLGSWDDEKAIACMRLAGIDQQAGRLKEALHWATEALRYRPWAECSFTAARIYNAMADRAGLSPAEERKCWEQAAYHARAGLASPITETPLWVNPLDRDCYIHVTLNVALAKLGDMAGALDSVRQARRHLPDDESLQSNEILYAAEIERQRASESAKARAALAAAAEKLLANKIIRRDVYDIVTGVCGGPKPAGSLDIVFACGESWESWDPSVIAERGLGGSEQAVLHVSRELAARGHRVRVYTNVPREASHDGVWWLKASRLGQPDTEPCDVLVAWRDATYVDSVPAKVRFLWAHDTTIANTSEWTLSLTDRILAVSEWHKLCLQELQPETRTRPFLVTRNGIDASRFDIKVARDPHKFVYSSAPHRGLEELLDLWPDIRQRVPDATLHIFYGFDTWEKIAEAHGDRGAIERMARIRARLEVMSAEGVCLRGRVSPDVLAKEMCSAGVWAFPSWDGDHAWFETSCIGAMEAQVAGLGVVTAAWGALAETAKDDDTVIIDGDAREEDWRSAFVEYAVRYATEMTDETRAALSARAINRFAWAPVAEQWERCMVECLGEQKTRAQAAHDECPSLAMIITPGAAGFVIDARKPLETQRGGGSASGFMGLARAMGRLGRYKVTAFGPFKEERVVVDGVEYVRIDKLHECAAPDVLFAFYDVTPLAGKTARLRIGSHHTYVPFHAWPWIDVNTAPSEHARRALQAAYRPHADWRVLPNAVEGLDGVEWRPADGRVVYHTSPDRGLHLLERVWPEIRAAVPGATLHIIGDPTDVMAWDAPHLRSYEAQRAREMKEAAAPAKDAGGVKYLGRLPRSQLLRELSQASCFAFPAEVGAPTETFSVSVLECCAIGVPVVMAPVDALRDVYSDSGVTLTQEPAREHLGEFAEAVIETLTRPDKRERMSARGRAFASRFSFDKSATVLDGIIREKLGLAPAKREMTNGKREPAPLTAALA